MIRLLKRLAEIRDAITTLPEFVERTSPARSCCDEHASAPGARRDVEGYVRRIVREEIASLLAAEQRATVHGVLKRVPWAHGVAVLSDDELRADEALHSVIDRMYAERIAELLSSDGWSEL